MKIASHIYTVPYLALADRSVVSGDDSLMLRNSVREVAEHSLVLTNSTLGSNANYFGFQGLLKPEKHKNLCRADTKDCIYNRLESGCLLFIHIPNIHPAFDSSCLMEQEKTQGISVPCTFVPVASPLSEPFIHHYKPDDAHCCHPGSPGNC